ncbi:intraflagellar transport complex B protein 46 C terminal-domain-containing protein [Gaertneriomyces semiglobifer]|nr:intraflagellar transport complex B protein 46 C terminal-domain-containing protein [Gaertneriomyces semiglobifer]
MRDDTPPSNLSQSESDYDDDMDDDDEEQYAMQADRLATSSVSTRPTAAPPGAMHTKAATSHLAPTARSTGIPLALHSNNTSEYDDEDDEDAASYLNPYPKKPSEPPTKMSATMSYHTLPIDNEIKELFEYVDRYKPQEQELEYHLKPFLPDFIPAIGDIDAFIKIPRPDGKPDNLGLLTLDEPSLQQSDPAVLDLKLRAQTKQSVATPSAVRSLPHASIAENSAILSNWISNMRDLHVHKPPTAVNYTKRMPDVEVLMQTWPAEVEKLMKSMQLPSADMDLPLPEFAKLCALILDIPVSAGPSSASRKHDEASKRVSTHIVEALHVMFTVFSEFKNSAHFKAIS